MMESNNTASRYTQHGEERGNITIIDVSRERPTRLPYTHHRVPESSSVLSASRGMTWDRDNSVQSCVRVQS
ncbi:hypothetical protein L227DRAFT_574720 [Lentinus tigrinus ALCF2SS1-6]|uniref:Uncharacterized protein n=1 Tax=Lentinus tigrinus ALCF2SS1-6 TaxID=1328759 RepID=A0A5C2SI72_9APHY|nr:hypothetical protein L227DRAFT_574720 [Lentinus tigrinus ALCF2SS1-6]